MADLFLPVIYGSVRAGRVSWPVAEFVVAEVAQRPGVTTHLYDPRELPFGNLERRLREIADPDPRAVRFSADMARADGFVLVTPEYNFGIPGTLKNLLDALTQEWFHKPFGLVTAGGLSGGLRAQDSLRVIVGGLRAIPVPAASPIHRVDEEFTAEGPKDPAKWRQRLTPMLRELEWYARALSAARAAEAPPSR
jgi:NAD(P)H-dependent FMN reductase